VVKIKHDKAELKLLEKPICVNLGDYITLSRIQNNSIMIVGRAKIVHGVESMLR